MIIEMLLTVVYNLFDLLLIIELPSLPEGVTEYISIIFEYMVAGAGILANYTPFAYLITLFYVVLLVDGGIRLYHFVMWILNKIPMLDID